MMKFAIDEDKEPFCFTSLARIPQIEIYNVSHALTRSDTYFYCCTLFSNYQSPFKSFCRVLVFKIIRSKSNPSRVTTLALALSQPSNNSPEK